MCTGLEPATMFAISTAMSAVSAGANYMMSSEQANAQAKYQNQVAEENNRAYVENAKIANKTYVEQAASTNIKQMQEQDAAAQELQDVKIERMEKAGTAMASSEAAGASFNMLMDDFMRQEAMYRDSVKHSLEMDQIGNIINLQGARREAENRGKSFQRYIPQPVQGPNFLGSMLSFGGDVFGAYDKYFPASSTSKPRVHTSWGGR